MELLSFWNTLVDTLLASHTALSCLLTSLGCSLTSSTQSINTDYAIMSSAIHHIVDIYYTLVIIFLGSYMLLLFTWGLCISSLSSSSANIFRVA